MNADELRHRARAAAATIVPHREPGTIDAQALAVHLEHFGAQLLASVRADVVDSLRESLERVEAAGWPPAYTHGAGGPETPTHRRAAAQCQRDAAAVLGDDRRVNEYRWNERASTRSALHDLT